ncbi:MAG: hypothetical protein LC624_01975 [Halobacteriales archaeon]|nr:hypothetical protein [Halobacteriales archaeon]
MMIPPASFFVGVHWLIDPLIAYAMVGIALVLALRWQPAFLLWAEGRRERQRVAGPVAGAEAEGAGALKKP